jgi:hypothetical protein
MSEPLLFKMSKFVLSKVSKDKQCQYDYCSRIAKYGYEIYNNIYCEHHKTINMLFTHNMRCLICSKVALYGYMDDKYPTRCIIHKQSQMINKSYEYCIAENCDRLAIYNERNIYKCRIHHNIILHTNKCVCCHNVAEYSIKSSISRTHCELHKTRIMLKSRKQTCLECHLYAVYGYNIPTHCSNHKYVDMDLLTNTKCVIESCKSFVKTTIGDKCNKHSHNDINASNINNIFVPFDYIIPCEKLDILIDYENKIDTL